MKQIFHRIIYFHRRASTATQTHIQLNCCFCCHKMHYGWKPETSDIQSRRWLLHNRTVDHSHKVIYIYIEHVWVHAMHAARSSSRRHRRTLSFLRCFWTLPSVRFQCVCVCECAIIHLWNWCLIIAQHSTEMGNGNNWDKAVCNTCFQPNWSSKKLIFATVHRRCITYYLSAHQL